MKRIAPIIAVLAALMLPGATAAASTAAYHESLCQERPYLCVDPLRSIGVNGEYTGHDEPSVLFTSNRPGTGGKDLTYTVVLPKNPPRPPQQNLSLIHI